MIVEGILTTEAEDGSMHVAPLGPHVDPDLQSWTLKPFQSSQTFLRLRATSRGVFHVVDDGLLLVRGVLGLLNAPNTDVDAHWDPDCGWILDDAVRALPLSVSGWNLQQERAEARCQPGTWKEIRPFWGWNRARNSLLELAILLSRRQWLDPTTLEHELERHRTIIEKTAGPREWEGLRLVEAALGGTAPGTFADDP